MAKILKMPIFHASVHTHDAESYTSMNIIFKYNTCIIKPHSYNKQAVHSIFHHIWTSLYGPVPGNPHAIDITALGTYRVTLDMISKIAWFLFIFSTSNVCHHGDIRMGAIASQITSLMIVYSTVYSAAHQRKHQSSTSLAFVRGIHRGPMNSPHKWPVTRKMFPFDDVIMCVIQGTQYPYYDMKCILSHTWIVCIICMGNGKNAYGLHNDVKHIVWNTTCRSFSNYDRYKNTK